MKGAVLRDVRPIGAEGRHLSLIANGVRGIWWGRGDLVEELRRDAARPRDVLFSLAQSDYGGSHVELRVRDIR